MLLDAKAKSIALMSSTKQLSVDLQNIGSVDIQKIIVQNIYQNICELEKHYEFLGNTKKVKRSEE
jgi:hypothetical protein